MDKKLTIVMENDYPGALAEALAGGSVVAVGADSVFRPEVPVSEPDAAVLVATSGSTGRPKVVVLSSAALLASVAATNDRLGGPGDWTCALPVRFVAGTMTLVRAIASGTAFFVGNPDLSDLPKVSGTSYLSLVPVQLDRALADPELLAKLERYSAILVGGSSIPESLLDRGRAMGLRLVTTYGMAETCGGCVYDGVPLPGVSVEIGAAGRILLDTPTAFSGYRLRPELTDEVLSGSKVRTADRGRFVAGALTVLGRLDDVAIVGGVNVDVAAVRLAATELWGDPLSGGVALVAVPDPRWGQVIVGVTTSDVSCDAVRDRLEGFPAEALPRRIVRANSLPLTVSGKIDYLAVAELAGKD